MSNLHFTGIVAILIIFQITATVNFWIGHNKSDIIIENQQELIKLLTVKELSASDKRILEVITIEDYKMCIDKSVIADCERYERLLEIKCGRDINACL
jgi:hypothetical protein